MRTWRRDESLGARALVGAWLGVTALAPAAAQPFNDTGIVQCAGPLGEVIPCGGTGQDAEFGRDVRRPAGGDGRLGFSFTKIGADGGALPASATEWSCVLDRVTGLMWEIKTDDGGLRDQDETFGNWADGRPGDAITYAADVNAQGLCGHADWRLPTRTELHSIADLSIPSPGPTLDPGVFPNSRSVGFSTGWWTSTTVAGNSRNAWVVLGRDGSVTYGMSRNFGYAVRLVRRASPLPTGERYVIDGAEVTDRLTGVVWRRCTEGQTWDGSTCVGTMLLLSWPEATQRALNEAAAAGQPWRLPNAKELLLMSDDRLSGPAIDQTVFPGVPTGISPFYWSGSLSVANSYESVWMLPSFSGALAQTSVTAASGTRTGHVRLVRDRPR